VSGFVVPGSTAPPQEKIDIAIEIQVLRVYAMRVPPAKIGIPPLLAVAKNHWFCGTGANRDRVGGLPERH
jgi:hypothetical protein